MTIALVHATDFHLCAEADIQDWGMCPGRALAQVLEAARQEVPEPEALLLTGDFSNDDTAASFRLGRTLLRRAFPAARCLFVPGNHDQNLSDLEAEWSESDGFIGPAASRRVCAADAGAWRVLLLNDVVAGGVHGELDKETLKWLDEQLAECDAAGRPALIALHHPLMPPAGNVPPWGVNHPKWGYPCLRDAANLEALLCAHPQARLVVHGHLHTEMHHRVGHADIYCSPSTCHQVKTAAPAWERDKEKKPAFRVLLLHPDGNHSTTVHHVDLGPDCYSPEEAA